MWPGPWTSPTGGLALGMGSVWMSCEVEAYPGLASVGVEVSCGLGLGPVYDGWMHVLLFRAGALPSCDWVGSTLCRPGSRGGQGS